MTRRTGSSSFAPGWAAALLLLVMGAACEQDPYRIINFGDGGAVDSTAPEAKSTCTKTSGGVEICDGKDNDCDDRIDEDFNLDKDPRHCGKCNNSCLLSGAQTACELRKCKFIGCVPGYYDMDHDLDKGWRVGSNGCEYACIPDGTEKCDGKDNDCNGKTDETFNLKNDVQNCGKCDNACKLANAVVKCDSGTCKVQSCNSGYINKDKSDANGCEAVCVKSNGGVEICDSKDNDCNGVVDDPGGKVIDFKTDPYNCGGCNVVCGLPNAYVSCLASACTFTGCKSSYVDADKDPTNGCECLPESGGETCDGKDNDCDGQTDKTSTGAALTQSCYTGAAGTMGKGPCKGGTQTCNTGSWGTCQGEVTPKTEYCDGTDTDCDNVSDPTACVFAATGREQRLDELSSTTLGNSNSTQLVIAGSGSRILAVWVDRRSNRSDLYANISTDGGKTWLGSDIAVATETYNKVEPQAALGGPQGSSLRAYVAYERFASSAGVRNVYLTTSTNGGSSWLSPVTLSSSSTEDSLYVRLAVVPGSSGSSDRVVVCWEQIAVSGAVHPDVYCRHSTNGGGSFSSAVRVNDTAGQAIVPQLAADSSYAYVTWQAGQAIKADRAALSGSGLSFGTDVTLSGASAQEPRIAADGKGQVAVVWEDVSGSLVNIRANRSSNYGQTWLAADERVDNDVVDGDSTSPSLAIGADGRIYVAWEDTCRGARDIYVGYLDKTTGAWANPVSIVPYTTAGSYTSLHPFIAPDISGSNVYVAWEDYRNGTYRDIYFSVSLDSGKTWNIPDYRIDESTQGLSDTRNPLLWVSSSRIAVLWIDNRTKTTSGVYSTGSNGDIYCSYVE